MLVTLTKALSQPRRLGVLALAGLLQASGAWALGLGEISLHSNLNQPLDATIDLVDVGGLDESELSAGLASADEFAKAGIDRTFFLNDLHFTPVIRNGRAQVKVTSNKAVVEPFLDFLVQVQRPGGQLMRHYVLLLDPAPAGSFPVVARAPQFSESPSSRSAGAVAAPRPAAPQPLATQGKRYDIQRGDTLWGIAKRLQQNGTPGSVDSLARDLRHLNPRALPIKAGGSLLLPDSAVLAGPSSVAAPPAQPPAPVVAPAAPAIEGLSQSDVDGLRNDLATLREENRAKDAQIEALQQQLAQSPHEASPQQPVAAPSSPVTPAVPVPPAEQSTPVAATAQSPLPPTSPAVSPPAVAPQPVNSGPAPVGQFGSDDESDWSSLMLWGAIAIVLLLLALAWLARRRRVATLSDYEPVPEPEVRAASAIAAAIAPAVVAEAASEVVPDAPEAAQPEAVEAPEARKAPARAAGQSDALEGAAIYLAYGRLNEARQVLVQAIEQEPERTDLRERLLEVLARQGDQSAYGEQEVQLRALGIDDDFLLALREQFGQHAPACVVPTSAPAVAPVVSEPVIEKKDEPMEDFQLNLDDLSMDADWELVSPFETRVRREPEKPLAVEPEEPGFASNLTDMPDLQELDDHHMVAFEPSSPAPKAVESRAEDQFLQAFLSEADLPGLEELTVDFDAIPDPGRDEQQLQQARECIDHGDVKSAIELLQHLIEDGDEISQREARQLLSKLA